MKYYFPVRFFPASVSNFSFLKGMIQIKRLDKSKLTKLCGLSDLVFTTHNNLDSGSIRLTKNTIEEYCLRNFYDELSSPYQTSNLWQATCNLPRGSTSFTVSAPRWFCMPNYVLEVIANNNEDAELKIQILNTVFKLIDIIDTVAYIGINENGSSNSSIVPFRLAPPAIIEDDGTINQLIGETIDTEATLISFSPIVSPFKPLYDDTEKLLELDVSTKNKIAKMFTKVYQNIEKLNKWDTISNLYFSSTFSNIFPFESRFLFLITLLEFLLVPDGGESLGFKLALRLSQLLRKFYKKEILEVYKNAKKLYDARSQIAHTGKVKTNTEENKVKIFTQASEYSVLLIRIYIDHPDIFEEEELINLCLE
jgi:hypothetical protein